MQIYRVELPVQLHGEPSDLDKNATWTKIHKDACTVTCTALAAGRALEGSMASPYSASLLRAMRESETVACECETFPTEARKNPKLSFMLKCVKAVLWCDGPDGGSVHNHARMTACLPAQFERLACTSERAHACIDCSLLTVRLVLEFSAWRHVSKKTLHSRKHAAVRRKPPPQRYVEVTI